MNCTLQVSVETALRVVYQPQAVFRVRPVSRCTASMPGESNQYLAAWDMSTSNVALSLK